MLIARSLINLSLETKVVLKYKNVFKTFYGFKIKTHLPMNSVPTRAWYVCTFINLNRFKCCSKFL